MVARALRRITPLPLAVGLIGCGPGASSNSVEPSSTSGLEEGPVDSNDAAEDEETLGSSGEDGRLDLPEFPDLPGGDGGVDETTCEAAAMSLTSAGCLFAPIVGNPSSAVFMGPLPWAVIAANTNEVAATVDLYDPNGVLIESAVVQPETEHVFRLDESSSFQWEHPSGTGVYDLAMRLESDRPIVAYQFQPYSTTFSATADATLLLPEHAWGDNYLAVEAAAGPVWVTVVALEDNTMVRVKASDYQGGSTIGGAGIPALGAGDEHTEFLDAQQTLKVYSNADITGLGIFTDPGAKVGVYVGSSGMSLPTSSESWNDYLECQVQPRAAWGTEYAVVKFQPRSSESDLYRVIADKDGTQVTVTGGPNTTYALDSGEFVEFLTPDAFLIDSNEAVLVAHMLTSASTNSGNKDPALFPGDYEGSANCGTSQSATDLGDPALMFVAPRDQWRTRYTFAAPFTYAWDMVTITAEMADWGTITMDGQPLPTATAIAGSTLGFARFLVDDGAHHVESDTAKFGLDVYGYDCRISYAYAGGLMLGSINMPPPPPP